jgi:rubrerythrin
MPHYHKILNNKIEKLTKKLARFGLPKAFSPVQLSKNRIFDDLAKEEKNHRDILTAFLRNPDKPLKFKPAPDDYKVAESVELPPLSLEMKPVDAIALAMKKEEEAMKTYLAFAAESDNAAQKGVFEELAKMEQGHKAKLEDIYTNMAFPEAW